MVVVGGMDRGKGKRGRKKRGRRKRRSNSSRVGSCTAITWETKMGESLEPRNLRSWGTTQ